MTTGEVLAADGSIHPGNAAQFAHHTQDDSAKAMVVDFQSTLRPMTLRAMSACLAACGLPQKVATSVVVLMTEVGAEESQHFALVIQHAAKVGLVKLGPLPLSRQTFSPHSLKLSPTPLAPWAGRTLSEVRCGTGRGHSILLLPEAFEPMARELGVARRVLDVAVPKPLLQRPGVMAVVGELVAARVPQHVRVDGEGELGRGADCRQELAEGRGRHGPAPLGGEDVDARWHLLALQAPERLDFIAPDEMHAGAAVLAAGDVVAALDEVEHVPAQGTKLTHAQPVAVGEKNHGRVAVRVPRADALLRDVDEPLGLFGGEVLPGSPLGIAHPPRRNFPIYSAWPSAFRHPFPLGLHRAMIADFPINSQKWEARANDINYILLILP
jgi:hypothetical protein